MNKYTTVIYGDFETYYSREFSLSKMPTINYCRDPRFEVFGVAIKIDDEPSVYLTHEEFASWAKSVDWTTVAFSAHNCQFDACVLTQHYNIFPAYYMCSQAASQALLPIDSVALKKVAPLLGLGEKGNALVEGAKTASSGMAEYAIQDNELSYGIIKLLYPMLSQDEQDLINLHIRQAVEPSLVLDVEVLKQVRDDAFAFRADAIAASGYSDRELTSNQQFSNIIRGLGLTAPTKLSDATGEEVEAFGKNSDEFVEFMLAHPEHKHIWDGRLAAKSNINVSRAEKFLSIAELNPLVPMPLKYCGAHTGRSSGADGLNVQNLPNKYKSNMRKAFTAPKGQVIVVVDSAQIELRVNMWLAGQEDKLAILASGGDIYKVEAANQFNISIDEVTKDQRQYGKLCQLGLGYGMGANKFRKTAAAGPLGMDPIYMTMEEAYNTVTAYRTGNHCVPSLWRALDQRIHQMTLPGLNEVDGVLTFVHEGVVLPSGRMIQYAGLHQTDEGQWVYGIDKKVKFLWGGTMDENIVQALARDIVFKQMLEIDKRYRVVSSTHDEILALCSEHEAEEALSWCVDIMSISSDWAPDLPLSAEGAFGKYYDK